VERLTIIEDVALDSFAGSDMELVIALEDGGIRISIEGEAVTITEDEETDEDADYSKVSTSRTVCTNDILP
jgi:hypothetical protein